MGDRGAPEPASAAAATAIAAPPGPDPSGPAPALVADGLTVEFGGEPVLDSISVSIPAGRSVALLGPNGAGKSTLLRAAVGLVEPAAGSIAVGARPVAYVPQSLAVEPGFPVTVRDVVAMGRYGELGWWRRFGPRDRELVAAGLSELGIAHLAGERFGELSGGERQRVLLAQAVAQDPALLLLDEPFTGVDRPTAEALRALLARWRGEGRTAIVATHDLERAAREYDLVLCLNRSLVAFGPAAEVCTEQVLAETFAGRVVRVGGLVVDVSHHHHGAG